MVFLYAKIVSVLIVIILIGTLPFILLHQCENKKAFVKEVKKNEKIIEKNQEESKEESEYFIKQQKKELKDVKKSEKAFSSPQEAIKKNPDIKKTWEEVIEKKLTPEQIKQQTLEALDEFQKGL